MVPGIFLSGIVLIFLEQCAESQSDPLGLHSPHIEQKNEPVGQSVFNVSLFTAPSTPKGIKHINEKSKVPVNRIIFISLRRNLL